MKVLGSFERLAGRSLCCILLVSFVRPQHPTCWYADVESSRNSWECLDGDYVIPTNFDVAQLHGQDRIREIRIAANNNVGLPGLHPLPPLSALESMLLIGFNEHIPSAFPLDLFLSRNKAQLKYLFLNRVKLLTLSATDMVGFSSLVRFIVDGCYLISVDKNVFSGLGRLPSGSIPTGYRPQLRQLQVSGNNELVHLDWSFLAPLADSLEFLNIHNNAIESNGLVSSRRFSLTSIKEIYLWQNSRLTSVPTAVLDSLKNTNTTGLAGVLTDNRFCAGNEHGDCSCCELAALGEWYRQYYAPNNRLHLSCGGKLNGYTSISVFANAVMHQHCPKPDPVPQPEPSPEPLPQPTPKPEPDPDTCRPVLQTIRASCVRGILTKPSIALDSVEATDFELKSDQSGKCRSLAQDLHTWLLNKSGLVAAGARRRNADSGVVAVCHGAGNLTLNELDPDAVTSGDITFRTAVTLKCLGMFFEFLEHFLNQ